MNSDKNKVYLKVPYADKDEAKSLGCRWDPEVKKWWTFKDNKNYTEIKSNWAEPETKKKTTQPVLKRTTAVEYDDTEEYDNFDEVLAEVEEHNHKKLLSSAPLLKRKK